MKSNREKTPIVTKDKKKDKAVLLKIIKIVFAVLAVLLVVAAVFGFVSDKLNQTRKERVIESEDDYLSGSFRNYYEEDYDADIFSEEEYMSLTRDIMFSTSSGHEYSLSDVEKELLSYGQRFFEEYFYILTHGEYEKYPLLFTKEYRDNPVGFEKYVERRFPMQRIYDIKVKTVAETTDLNGEYTYNGEICAYGFYEVSFKILRNDGAFRRDLPENGERPVIYELVTLLSGEDAGKTMIKNMYTVESLINAEED